MFFRPSNILLFKPGSYEHPAKKILIPFIKNICATD